MDKESFRSSLDALGLSIGKFSELTGWSERTVYAWGDRTPVPYQARLILALLADRSGISIEIEANLSFVAKRARNQEANRFKVI